MARSWIVWILAWAIGCTAQGNFAESEVGDEASLSAAPFADAEEGFVAASAERSSAPPADAPQAPRADRQVIYSAALQLVVVSVRDASNQVLALAKAAGGHLQSSDSSSIIVRVPAAQFEVLLAQIEKLGEVVHRNVSASDVTEQVLELEIRLDNAKRARERLLVHLEKSEKVEDTLKIESELARVTLDIERIEGQLRLLRSRVALSTIEVRLNSRAPQRGASEGLAIPFEWVGRLGNGLLAGAVESLPRKPNLLTRGPSFTPPNEFLRYYSNDDLVEAMNADGVRIKVQRHSNFDSGALAFWFKLARQSLVEGRSLAVEAERIIGDDRGLLTGSRDVGGVRHGYLLLIARTPNRVYSFEAFGPWSAFEPLRDALEKSALTLQR